MLPEYTLDCLNLMKKPTKTTAEESIDDFLQNLDTPLSHSQQQEIKKHQRISRLRDQTQTENSEGELWPQF